jgi:PKD repeat protein
MTMLPHLPVDRSPRRTDPTQRTRQGATVFLVGMLAFSGYGTFLPAAIRCVLPGDVGCPGGIFGAPVPGANATNEMFFNVTLYDYGFWIINSVTGANETKTWVIYEGWTIHINATSLRADASAGGTAYHGLGVEINATGKQLLSLAAPVGKWVTGTFTAPTSAYYSQHIWCTVYCGDGHSGQYRYNLNVVPSTTVPSALISATPTWGAAPLLVSFTAQVSGGTGALNTTWTFGDGSSPSYVANASHTYTLSGAYTAQLVVTDAKGSSATRTVRINVSATTPLTVSVHASVADGVAPLEVDLAGTVAGGVAPYTEAWTFGDGGTGVGLTAAHLFTAPGSYTVDLTVTDAVGASAWGSTTVAVHKANGTFPLAVQSLPASGVAPLPVTLTESPQGGTGPFAVLWVFGDGSFGSGPSANHTYATHGAYEATAFVTDAQGRVASGTVAVNVSGTSAAALQSVLTGTPLSGAPPLTFNASLSVWGGTAPYGAVSWTFGDGNQASGATVAHTFATLGTYPVTAALTDGAGATTTARTQVVVQGLQLSITLNRTSGDAPLLLGASASILGGTGTYGTVAWTWGDGATGSGSPINHTYGPNVTGAVTLHAQVADSSGATATASASVTIVAPPIVTVSINGSVPQITPADVNFTLAVTAGSGGYSTTPLWSFGDGATTRGVGPMNHTYVRTGSFLVTVVTNDSAGGVATGAVWVNISGGDAAGAPSGTAPVWTFTGVADPNQAALELMGFMALSGLFLLYRRHFMIVRRPAPGGARAPAARPNPPTSRSSTASRTPAHRRP